MDIKYDIDNRIPLTYNSIRRKFETALLHDVKREGNNHRVEGVN